MEVLIAEDEVVSRQLLQGQREDLGDRVTVASDGVEAWELLEQQDFSIVITDWMMPGMDGLELVRRIRSRESQSYVYIIVLTAKSEKQDVVQGIMEGADDFLVKPYDLDELSVILRAGERIVDLEKRLQSRNDELLSAKREIEVANKRMQRDLEAAARIQRSLLPAAKPEFTDVTFAWVYRPCDELAGDIFNVISLSEELLGIYVLDVVGHGVPAALLSVTLSRFLSPTAGNSSVLFSSAPDGKRPLTPAELATELNRQFPMHDSGQFFTLLFGYYDTRTRELRYVSAGHPGPVHIPAAGPPQYLRTEGFPIGVSDQPAYREECLTLAAGDHILFYSDGLSEAENAAGEYFGVERIQQCLAQRPHNVEQAIDCLVQGITGWCGGERQKDDISILAMAVC